MRDITLPDAHDLYVTAIYWKKHLKVFCGFANQPYDIDTDLNTGDFNSFRKGYVSVQILMLRIMRWPTVKTTTMGFDGNMKYMLKLS